MEIQQQKLIDFEKKDNPTQQEMEDYLFGVVEYYSQSLSYDLSKQNVDFSDCINKIVEKLNNVESKFNNDKNSCYWAVC